MLDATGAKLIRITKQKQAAEFVLQKIEELFDPSAIVAGGAPRNWYFKDEAKDIDIFMCPTKKRINNEKIYDTLHTIKGLRVTRVQTGENLKEYSRNPYLKTVFKCEYTHPELDTIIPDPNGFLPNIFQHRNIPIKFEIMWMTDPVSDCVLKTFPVNISMVSFKYGRIITTEDFLIAVDHKIIYLNKVENIPVSYLYIDKLYTYYPNFIWLQSKPIFYDHKEVRKLKEQELNLEDYKDEIDLEF